MNNLEKITNFIYYKINKELTAENRDKKMMENKSNNMVLYNYMINFYQDNFR